MPQDEGAISKRAREILAYVGPGAFTMADFLRARVATGRTDDDDVALVLDYLIRNGFIRMLESPFPELTRWVRRAPNGTGCGWMPPL